MIFFGNGQFKINNTEKLNQILFCDVKLEQRSLENLIYFANDILK